MDANKGYINFDEMKKSQNCPDSLAGGDAGKTVKDGGQGDKYVKSWIGVSLALLSGTCNAIAYMFIVWVQVGGGSQFQIAFLCGLSMTLLSLLFILCQKVSLLADDSTTAFLIVSNGVLRTLADISIFYALPRAPIGNVAVIVYGGIPIFAAVMSCLCLKEKCRYHNVLAFSFVIIGVFLVAKPHFLFPGRKQELFSGEDLAYVSAAAGALGLAASLTIGRSLADRVDPLTTVFYNGFISALINSVILVSTTSPSNWALPTFVWVSVFGVCSLVTVTEWSLFSALQLETAPTVILLTDVRIAIAYLLDIFVLHSYVDVWDLIGATLVTIATLIVAIASCWINFEDIERETELEMLLIKSNEAGNEHK